PRKGQSLRGVKRHPTLEDNVTIYPNATILGGDTVVGRGSIIGGNVWIVNSIAPNSLVTLSENQTKMNIKTCVVS
ncbi:MAG TPA: serine acetyltransferase, partial [Spirochaetota bacterium]|nr:serine acetyltransferase [Spirochaetota bacterium]